jgi:hypothetical protein
MRLVLDDVTLCAADCLTHDLAARALARSMGHCDFAEALLLSDRKVEGPFRTRLIEPLRSIDDYSAFLLRGLREFIQTPFVLVTQWDGYVVDPQAWCPEFRDYDYIGAVWPWYADGMRVGNGGFSLRSRRLLDALAQPAFALPAGINEDEAICRQWRPALEREHGLRFAPEALAERFSHERGFPEQPSFGFHALFNFCHYVDDAELAAIVGLLPAQTCRRRDYAQLLLQYLVARRPDPFRTLYARLAADLERNGILELLRGLFPEPGQQPMLNKCVDFGERMLGRAPAGG